MQRQKKYYVVRPSYLFRTAAVEVHPAGQCTRAYDVTPASYNRLVALANSGQVDVQILDADYGVAWQMQRK